jgi:hypothetical protein
MKLSAEQYDTWLEQLAKQGHVSCPTPVRTSVAR